MPRPDNLSGLSRVDRGRLAERAVCTELIRRGWTIVATNLRLGRLELDVVARRGSVVAVVEVRTRGPTAWESAFGSMTFRKRQRIRRAGERLWNRKYRSDSGVERLRFDAASVRLHDDGSWTVEYAEAAF